MYGIKEDVLLQGTQCSLEYIDMGENHSKSESQILFLKKKKEKSAQSWVGRSCSYKQLKANFPRNYESDFSSEIMCIWRGNNTYFFLACLIKQLKAVI